MFSGPKIMTAKRGFQNVQYISEERDKSLLDFMGMNKNAGKSPVAPSLPKEVLTQPNFEQDIVVQGEKLFHESGHDDSLTPDQRVIHKKCDWRFV